MADSDSPRQLLTEAEFDEAVRSALRELPDGIHGQIENVSIVVEERSDNPNLLGLYYGIPLSSRSHWYRSLPDQITIYREPIESLCKTADEVREQVRKTVLHEIGHYFGMTEEQLTELGYG